MQDELNILREVGSIASAQGSRALSEILGRQVNLNIPATDIISLDDLPNKAGIERTAIAIFSKMHVGLPGEIVLILDEKAAFKIIGMSYKLDEQTRNAGIFTEVGMSLLKEVGNIIIVSYVMAMGQILKRNILTSLPTFVSGSLDNILNAIFAQYSDKDYIFFIEAVFEEPEEKVRGGFCLAITQEAADDIKAVCKKILEDLEK